MKQLIILRGISGSGKSTLAKKLGEGGLVYSADDFFMWNGEYRFDPNQLPDAHKWNQDRARDAMSFGMPLIVIDNTNTTFSEMKPYVRYGLHFGYEISFVETDTPWCKDAAELVRRNTHNVPLEVIQAMLARWQDNPTIEAVMAAPDL